MGLHLVLFFALSCSIVPADEISYQPKVASQIQEEAPVVLPVQALPEKKAQSVAFIDFEVEVNESTASQAIAAIKTANEEGISDIVIRLDTPGGEVRAGMKMSKAMEASTSRVTCVVDGMAASMGMYLLQSCDVRIMTKQSMLMAHQPAIRSFRGGPSEDFGTIASYLSALNVALAEHIVARMNITSDELMAHIRGSQEWWFSWQDAVKYGAVDKVVDSIEDVLVVQ